MKLNICLFQLKVINCKNYDNVWDKDSNYPLLFLEACKYTDKEKKISRYINENLEISSNDSDEEASDESDKEASDRSNANVSDVNIWKLNIKIAFFLKTI